MTQKLIDKPLAYRYSNAAVYNKLFAKILDSSIWLEPDTTRIVWITCLASMDEDGFVQFASVPNLARRANVSVRAGQRAVECLEAPDPNSSDPDHEGRRLERVEGGWIVINADKYRKLVTRLVAREQTRLRVQRHRNARKRLSNASVTPSEAISEVHEEREKIVSLSPAAPSEKPKPRTADKRGLSDGGRDPFTDSATTERAGRFVERYQALYREHRKGARYALRPARDYQAAVDLCATWEDDSRLEKLAVLFLTTDHKFAEEGSRTIPQFLGLASWCDGKLAEWESTQRARA